MMEAILSTLADKSSVISTIVANIFCSYGVTVAYCPAKVTERGAAMCDEFEAEARRVRNALEGLSGAQRRRLVELLEAIASRPHRPPAGLKGRYVARLTARPTTSKLSLALCLWVAQAISALD